MSIINEILAEAEAELFGSEQSFQKEANDQNGAPEQARGQQAPDIASVAKDYMAKVESFKSNISQLVAGAQGQGQGGDEEQMAAMQQQQASEQAIAANPAVQEKVIIQRPDGTQIKVAELLKLAQLRRNSKFNYGVR